MKNRKRMISIVSILIALVFMLGIIAPMFSR